MMQVESTTASSEDQDLIKILLLGRTGQGKSTFINKLLGKEVANTGGIEQAKGVTKLITSYKGKVFNSGSNILIYDTPGFGDQDVSFFDLVEQIEEEICGKAINFVVYVQRGDEYRIESDTITNLKLCQEFLADKTLLHKQFIIVLTHGDKMENEAETASEFLNQIKTSLGWHINKIVCFSKNYPEKSLTDLIDYMAHSQPLNILKEIPALRIHEELIKEFGDKKDFFGNKIIPENVPIIKKNENISKKFEVVLIGSTAVGKTSIIHRLVKNSFSELTQPTIVSDIAVLREKNYEIKFWDTAGQERFNSVGSTYLKRANMVFLVFDLKRKDSFMEIENWLNFAKNQCIEDTLIVLVGNGCDKPDIQVSEYEVKQLMKNLKISYYFKISAKSGENIGLLKESLQQFCKKRRDDCKYTSNVHRMNVYDTIVLGDTRDNRYISDNCMIRLKRAMCPRS